MDTQSKIEELEGRIAALESMLQTALKRAEADVVVGQHREFVERIRASREVEAP